MLKLVGKCSCNNGGINTKLFIHGFRRSLLQFSTSSSSTFTQQQEEHPSASLPKYLVENLGFSEQQSLSISPKIARHWQADGGKTRVSALTFATNANSVIHFFKSHGFHDSHIRNLVSYDPRILNVKIHETLIPRFKVLQDLGISGSDLTCVISANPELILRRLDPVFQDLRVFLGTSDNLLAFLKRFCLLRTNTSSISSLISNARLLQNDYGIPADIVRQHIFHNKTAFMKNPEFFKDTVIKVEHKWGISPSSGMFLHGVGVFGSLTEELIESKIQLFKSFGWNQSHIMTIINKFPRCLYTSEAKLTKSLEFLMNDMRYEPAFLACRPALFTYSLETRLLPRQRILVVLREKGLISTAALYSAAVLTESKFFHKFIQPFKDDVPDLYENYLSNRGCLTLGQQKTNSMADGIEVGAG